MRTVIVLFVLLGCSAEPSAPAPPVRCTPGAVEACTCATGSGTRSCLADSTFGGCLCPRPDAGSMDGAVSDVPCGGLCGAGTVCEGGRCVGADAGTADARGDAPDAPRDPRCLPEPGIAFCEEIGACADLQRSERACGRCGNVCPDGHRCCRGGCVPPGNPCQ